MQGKMTVFYQGKQRVKSQDNRLPKNRISAAGKFG
jgi:hypothetical protein